MKLNPISLARADGRTRTATTLSGPGALGQLSETHAGAGTGGDGTGRRDEVGRVRASLTLIQFMGPMPDQAGVGALHCIQSAFRRRGSCCLSSRWMQTPLSADRRTRTSGIDGNPTLGNSH